jgi:hypothetical protein
MLFRAATNGSYCTRSIACICADSALLPLLLLLLLLLGSVGCWARNTAPAATGQVKWPKRDITISSISPAEMAGGWQE